MFFYNNTLQCVLGMGHFTSPPGGSCAALQSCSGGSICRSGWCVCPEATMVVINGFCLISNNNFTTSQPDAEEVVSDYSEEESSATDDLPNPIDISQPNLPPVLNVGQPTGNGGQQFVNSAQQQPGNSGQQFAKGQQMANGGQQTATGGQRVVTGGQFMNNGPLKGAQPLHNSGQTAANFGQQAINVGRLSTSIGQPSLNAGQSSFNGGLQSLNLGQSQFLQQVPPNSLGVAPKSPSLGFSSESVSNSIGMGSLMTNANFNPLQLGFSNLPNASVLKPTVVKSSNFTNNKQLVRPGASCG